MKNIPDFEGWAEEDYIRFFLNSDAAQSRLSGGSFPIANIADEELEKICAPVRQAIVSRYAKENAVISIIIRAYNEEKELLPTLVSYAFCCDIPAPTELILVDNNSSDRTGLIARYCGVKVVTCKRPGIGHATKRGYESICESSKYVLITDADVRPSKPVTDEIKKATFLNTSYDFLESNPNAMGVSTGTELEAAHWSYWLFNYFGRKLSGLSFKASYWAGTNQFMRRSALDAIGGIDADIEYGCSEDHARRFALARWCKPQGFELPEGTFVPILVNPNFHSGRRHGTLLRVLRHIVYSINRRRHPVGDDGWPIFEKRLKQKKISIR